MGIFHQWFHLSNLPLLTSNPEQVYHQLQGCSELPQRWPYFSNKLNCHDTFPFTLFFKIREPWLPDHCFGKIRIGASETALRKSKGFFHFLKKSTFMLFFFFVYLWVFRFLVVVLLFVFLFCCCCCVCVGSFVVGFILCFFGGWGFFFLLVGLFLFCPYASPCPPFQVVIFFLSSKTWSINCFLFFRSFHKKCLSASDQKGDGSSCNHLPPTQIKILRSSAF